MNELNRSMGMSDAYPFHLTPAVRGKLHFVHLAILKARTEVGLPDIQLDQLPGPKAQ